MEKVDAALITCSVYNSVAETAKATMREFGVKDYHHQPSRATKLHRKDGIWGIGSGVALEEEPATRFMFYVARESADGILQGLISECSLQIPGRGSAVCEEVEIAAESSWNQELLKSYDGNTSIPMRSDLSTIVCTVQQGQGNHIARSALDLGVPMPQVTAGEGTGLRDKLSVIRVTVPAEKEVISVMVSAQESDEIFPALVAAGRINELGAGFIYESPGARGVINDMVVRGQHHSASMEQLIAAVDDMKGSADWRRRPISAESQGFRYLNDLVGMVLICNEGTASELVIAAMEGGAGGATIGKQAYSQIEDEQTDISPARESAELIVGKDQVDGIYDSLLSAGLYGSEASGFIALKNVSVACTHLSAPR
jgi:hypothetical protein